MNDNKNCWTKRGPENGCEARLKHKGTHEEASNRINRKQAILAKFSRGAVGFVSKMGKRLEYYHSEIGPQCFDFQLPLHPDPSDIPSFMFYCSPDSTSRMWKL